MVWGGEGCKHPRQFRKLIILQYCIIPSGIKLYLLGSGSWGLGGGGYLGSWLLGALLMGCEMLGMLGWAVVLLSIAGGVQGGADDGPGDPSFK